MHTLFSRTSPLAGALRRSMALAIVAAVLMTSAGCFTQRVPVNGGVSEAGATETEFNQWFVLWGLVPITQVEADVVAATPESGGYNLVSTFTPVDCVINFFTSIVTVYRKSIIVETAG